MKNLIALFLLLVSSGATSAGGTEDGARLFALHCAACHGPDAQGNGAVAGALTGTPADLTLLSQQNGGSFPVSDVVAKIDGRVPLAGHGTDMPVYGWFFKGEERMLSSDRGADVRTTEAIAAIVLWLKSVQQ